MYKNHVLLQKLNYRNIVLRHETRGGSVGVRLRDGEYRFYPWLGFIDVAEAQNMAGAKPVKLKIARVGTNAGISTEWRDLEDPEYVQGCLVAAGVYAVVESEVRVVGATSSDLEN